MAQTMDQLIARAAELSLDADESGFPEFAAGQRQIVMVAMAKLPRVVVQRLVNTGFMLADTVLCANKISGRRGLGRVEPHGNGHAKPEKV